jgi:nucleotide-binding universal stress UspA family protein
MIDKILVALDYADNNQSIFETAVSLAQTNGAKLMLLHILSAKDPNYPILPTYAYYSILEANNADLFQEHFAQYQEKGINFLQDLNQKAIAAGVETKYTQISGIPGCEICQLARTWSADLILVGSRGLKGLKEMFLGSVSNYVTHHAPCSVLIVRTNTDSVFLSASADLSYLAEVNNQQEVFNTN